MRTDQARRNSKVLQQALKGEEMSRKSSFLSSVVLALGVALVGALALAMLVGPRSLLTASPGTQAAAAQGQGVTVEFLGWSHYRLTSPNGKVIVTNPFITNNADAAITLDEAIARGADVILVADGHGDERGNALDIVKATNAQVVVPFELGTYFLQNGAPASQVIRSGPGGAHRFDGITVRVLNSVHGGGITVPDAPVIYSGPAVSYMITFENGFTLYFSGSSAATMDMQLWGDWYKPDAAILHQDPNHEPRDAAAVGKFLTTNNPNLKTVFPHHHRLQTQPNMFTPNDLRTALQQLDVNVTFIDPVPLQPYTLTK
jgi:L-ascorbate metabolism protein UlaG (beta-lactamase superfamily)